jgi:hypothetical protein
LDGIEPKNLTAQLDYRGMSNPPDIHPRTAVSNSFPGLELDFRDVWRRIFVGLEMHEGTNLVVAAEPDAPDELKRLVGNRLLSVGGDAVVISAYGPPGLGPTPSPTTPQAFPEPEGPPAILDDDDALEWSNALAHVLARGGGPVRCVFRLPDGVGTVDAVLTVRSFFERDADGNPLPVIAQDLVRPGDLTQSLCSPWQNDYRECGCYYWAASRPDYIDIAPTADGKSDGFNWLQKDRGPTAPRGYSFLTDDIWNYEELFRKWEEILKFQIGGKDAE